MTNRIKIASGGASPFRVSAPGVDVNGATFDGLLFDGNQMPMRVYSTGYANASISPVGAIVDTPALYGPPTPSGTYPLFTVAWRVLQDSATLPLRTVGPGAGATFDSNNRLHTLTFSSVIIGSSVLINYLIFRNAG